MPQRVTDRIVDGLARPDAVDERVGDGARFAQRAAMRVGVGDAARDAAADADSSVIGVRRAEPVFEWLDLRVSVEHALAE